MNKQIKQLAEQARVQDRGYFIYQYGGPTGHQSVEKAIDLEKFAELIVAECAGVGYDASYYECALNVSNKIRQHFGVEE